MSFEYMPELRWHFGYPLVIGRTTLVRALAVPLPRAQAGSG